MWVSYLIESEDRSGAGMSRVGLTVKPSTAQLRSLSVKLCRERERERRMTLTPSQHNSNVSLGGLGGGAYCVLAGRMRTAKYVAYSV